MYKFSSCSEGLGFRRVPKRRPWGVVGLQGATVAEFRVEQTAEVTPGNRTMVTVDPMKPTCSMPTLDLIHSRFRVCCLELRYLETCKKHWVPIFQMRPWIAYTDLYFLMNKHSIPLERMTTSTILLLGCAG